MSEEKLLAERATIETAMGILGLPARSVQKMAQRGEIPGAARFGRRWTFNLDKLRGFVRMKERETWENAKHQPAVTGVAIPSGVKPRLTGAHSDGRLAQVIQKLRANASKPASNKRSQK